MPSCESGKNNPARESNMKVIIQMSQDEPFYLDGTDGETWEWTAERKKAWRMEDVQADRIRIKLKDIAPNAVLLEA